MNYKNNKIYLISSHEAPNEHSFISSTTQKYLSQRFEFHKSSYRKFRNKLNEIRKIKNPEEIQNFKDEQYRKSGYLFKLIGEYDNGAIFIKLLEEYPCESKDAQRARELHYIQTMPNINKSGFKGYWDLSEDEDEDEDDILRRNLDLQILNEPT